MGAQLDKVRVPVVEHAAHRRLEKNCGTRILPPVRCAVVVSGQSFASHRGIQRDRRRTGSQFLERADEVAFDGVHVVGVIRHFPGEKPVEDLQIVEVACDLVKDIAIAGDGNR